MSDSTGELLIIGYGNPGRQDDGLGPALAEAVERLALPGVAVDSDYQLTVEHAEMAARHRVVVFADAAAEGGEHFTWSRVEPAETPVRFSSHHLAPADVLGLARDLFSAQPEGYVLAIRGRRFGHWEPGLSGQARVALNAAVSFLAGNCSRLTSGCLQLTPRKDLPCKTEST